MILRLSGENVDLERLIFVKPMKTIDFDISLDKDLYEPGDKVTLNISPYYKGEVYASVHVVDVSSFLKVPKYKHQPSLPSMVFLEKEVEDCMGDFEYSDEYIDHIF